MNVKTILYRLAALIALSLLGGFLFAVTANLLILFDTMPAQLDGRAYGLALAHKSAFVWMGSIVLGFVGIFVNQKWRMVLTLAPLYAPSLFAVLYTLYQTHLLVKVAVGLGGRVFLG